MENLKLRIKNIVIETKQAKITIPEIELEGVNKELATLLTGLLAEAQSQQGTKFPE